MPTELGQRARRAIERGTEFLLANRYEPGGWLGFWGINITYGTFFATSGLLAAGVSRSHPHIAKSVRWLLAHQRPDGGWGEHSDGVLHSRAAFVPADEPSLVVQTAWALLTLLDVAPHEKEAIDRGIAFLIERQPTDGQWPRERASGVFFNTAVLDYDLYRQTFPTWALARYQRVIAPGPSQRF
jgi:lanosterol synthase